MKIDKDKSIQLPECCKFHSDNSEVFLPENRKKEAWMFTQIDEQDYFHKMCTPYNLISELLGSYFSKQIGLNAVENKIGFIDGYNSVYAVSKSFYKEGYTYYFMDELGYDDKEGFEEYNFLRKVKKNFGKEILNELLKLIVIDLKMGQVDRHGQNITFYRKDFLEKFKLAPLYDFSYSYMHKKISYYKNPFILININLETLKLLVEKYPIIMESIDIVKDIRIEDALDEISRETGCIFSGSEINFFSVRDVEYTKILRKI